MKKPALLFALIVVVGIAVYFYYKSNSRLADEPILTPTPEETQIVSSTEVTEETIETRSPDGEMVLAMEISTQEGLSSYSFYVSGEGDVIPVFTKELPVGSVFEIPQNTWSPDNKYFFIKEKLDEQVSYYVFKSDGESFSEERKYLEVVPSFLGKDTGYILRDVTGWASPTLLYMLTEKESGEEGPTYWFEVPSESIIRLASR